MGARGQADNLIGKTLGQFEILDEVGRGGMATVYRARQKSINRTVALKVLPPALLHDPNFYERFTREVDVIAHLEHPHIVPIYDFGEAEGIPYIAMRFLAGGSVASFVRRGLPTLQQIEQPLAQIAQGLDHAHLQGIIHRDLKPGNILLDERNNAYLTDFGIARVLDSNLTGSAIIGTPAYMSPEQANGQPLDSRADIYSLGIVLFEMITGREPFEAETPVALLLKHINEPMPSVRVYRPGVSRLVEQVVLKATAKNPNERYASAGDLSQAFSEAVRLAPREIEVDDAPTMLPNFDDMPLIIETPPKITPPPVRTTPPLTPYPPTPRSATQSSFSTEEFTPTLRDTPRELLHQSAISQTGTGAGKQGTGTSDPSTAEFAPVSAPPADQPKPNRAPLIIGGVVAVVAIIALILALPSLMTPGGTPLPTPFVDAVSYDGSDYIVNVPDAWSQTGQSDEYRAVQIWQDGDQAFVTISTVMPDAIQARSFVGGVNEYHARFYASQTWLTEIDSDINDSDAGMMRRSYRLSAENGRFPDGQLDVFYLRLASTFYVIETYSSDESGNSYVPTLQDILNSLRLTESA